MCIVLPPALLFGCAAVARTGGAVILRGTKGGPKEGGLSIGRHEDLNTKRIESKPQSNQLLLTTPIPFGTPLVPCRVVCPLVLGHTCTGAQQKATVATLLSLEGEDGQGTPQNPSGSRSRKEWLGTRMRMGKKESTHDVYEELTRLAETRLASNTFNCLKIYGLTFKFD